ncbi:MAG: metalloregulator ArsR/SmtB family transcription factor [Algiphilus sp.]|uniref:ArsR/SmtB family transcription factor n=1 Tax=Algiphilus sp. TaxID=1872431 RepID=UPI001CA76E3B|nr:metalloregulator ArsR/SmtB family transcription factor [Algiphilus sp.]MBY8966602.1 helix-turn-helix transcriptional regulator [Algiphilus acroporae]MCI5062351.1 metalloregulator ArsR/SmtB family transcription factor [Algiphilus sp.]MCI5102961.1 metalloregulator ArsR/SmtB family transcription factor [Algiphilus sp.]
MAHQYDASQLREAAAIFHALSDPARLNTLTLLAAQPQSVSHLAEAMGERIGTVSARLKVLLQARLVTRSRQGQSAIYSLSDEHVFQLIANALEHADEHPHR